MNWKDGITTSPTLLRRLGDWRDHGAWLEFVGRYDPLIRLWSRRFNLDADATEELCQQIWIDLARRMRTYTYDSSLTFRGWLRRTSQSRAVDLLRKRRADYVDFLDDLPDKAYLLSHEATGDEQGESPDRKRLLLLRLGKQIHDTVRSRVEPQTWLAFWRIAVEDCSVRETAGALGMSYAAAFAGAQARAANATDRGPSAPERPVECGNGNRSNRLSLLGLVKRRSPSVPGCPTDGTLGRLGAESLGETSFSALEKHIQECRECQDSLERLARAGSLNEVASEAHVPDRDQTPEVPGFILGRELGRGGMGVVYQAWQIDLNREVAVKFLRSGPSAGAKERQRWLREAQSVSRVRHRNVAQIFQVGEEAGWLYLVLDLIPGGSLANRCTKPLPSRVAVEIVEAISRAVEHIHCSGLLHLDIKPSNILLDGPTDGDLERMIPMIADFGISRFGDDPSGTLTGLTSVQGSPSYMAPEQVTGDRSAIGPAADIFSVGATFYHLLTGRPPFSSTSILDTLEQVRTQEPISPRTLNPSVPRDLETICVRCLQKDPKRRYASACELADDLRRWLDWRPISARPVSPLERAWRWCRRRPVVAALAITLILTLSVGFLSIALLWRHAEAERRRAEADFEVTVEALGEFIALSRGKSPFKTTPESRASLVVLLQRTRKLCLELAVHRPDHPMIPRRLAFTDLHLAELLLEIGRFDEARPLLIEALATWERVVLDSPQDIDVLCRQLDSFDVFARVAAEEGKIEEIAQDSFSRP